MVKISQKKLHHLVHTLGCFRNVCYFYFIESTAELESTGNSTCCEAFNVHSKNDMIFSKFKFDECFAGEEPEPGIGMCGWLLTSISWFLVIITLPFSLCVCFKVIKLFRHRSHPFLAL